MTDKTQNWEGEIDNVFRKNLKWFTTYRAEAEKGTTGVEEEEMFFYQIKRFIAEKLAQKEEYVEWRITRLVDKLAFYGGTPKSTKTDNRIMSVGNFFKIIKEGKEI